MSGVDAYRRGLLPSDPLTILSQWAVSMHAFRRNRVPVAKKVVAAALCNSGYSYRDVSRMVGGLSYIAARDAFYSLQTSLEMEVKKYRTGVAIDGCDVGVGQGRFHLWLARDVESGRIMSFSASPDGSAEDGARFLAGVAAQCLNRPILRLGTGPNLPRGLVNYDLYFQIAPEESLLVRLGRLLMGGAS